jgi:RNA polymerase sigma-70 factor, ECF subfamily
VKAVIEARPRYIRFANSILANTQDAEDVVQDCYIRLYERREADAISNTEAYMMRAVRNASIDYLKKKRPDVLEEKHELLITVPADVLRHIDSREHTVRLERLMSLLPEKQRTVFYLRDVEGYELKEIESVTGLSNEGVRTCLCRARKHLRDLYNQLK